MAYPYTTSTPKRLAADILASPKTHGPFAQVEKRGLRFYHPGLGRFINRDPAGYLGGNNIFAFVGNNPCCRVDLLGLTDTEYYDVGGPYYQLALKLGPDEWGTASAVLTYRLLTGNISTKKEADSSCSDCYRRVVTYKRDVEFYADKLKIRLPNWTAYSSASADEKKAWDSMIAALTAHEQHHIDIYKEFNAVVNLQGVGSDCLYSKAKQAAWEAFKKKLDDEFKKREDENEKKQKQYDADTNHGANEGVVLPQV